MLVNLVQFLAGPMGCFFISEPWSEFSFHLQSIYALHFLIQLLTQRQLGDTASNI